MERRRERRNQRCPSKACLGCSTVIYANTIELSSTLSLSSSTINSTEDPLNSTTVSSVPESSSYISIINTSTKKYKNPKNLKDNNDGQSVASIHDEGYYHFLMLGLVVFVTLMSLFLFVLGCTEYGDQYCCVGPEDDDKSSSSKKRLK